MPVSIRWHRALLPLLSTGQLPAGEGAQGLGVAQGAGQCVEQGFQQPIGWVGGSQAACSACPA